MIALTFAGCTTSAEPSALPEGDLLLLEELGPPIVSRLDVQSSTTEAWYSVTSGGFAYALDTDDDGATLSYTAPAAEGKDGYDRSRIVHVGAHGTLTDVACRDAAGVWCFYPANNRARTWFVIAGEDVASGVEHALAYVDAAGGEIHEVAPWGTEPAVSTDGSRLAWVAIDPDTRRRSLILGDSNGAAERTLLASGDVTDISAVFFSPDDAWLYFVVPTPAVSALAWLVPTAQAHGNHDVPGDWWRVSAAGGDPEQVTWLDTVLYDGRAHADGGWFAAATREGVVLIDATGEATTVLETRTVRGLAWVR